MENKYSRSKIYKLDCGDGYFYIGSTVQPLSTRLGGHKVRCKKQPDTPIYKYINEIGWENVKIILVSNHCLENREQLLREEDKYIKEHINDEYCLNTNRALRTKQEYYNDNKEQLAEKHKQYRNDNKEQIKQYYNDNKEQLAEKHKQYRNDNKEQLAEKQKQYYIENKDIIKEKGKQYYDQNKKQILEKQKQTYTCECGSILTISHKLRHEKSKKHIDYINSKITSDDVACN